MNQLWCPECKRWVYAITRRDSDMFHQWWQTECEFCGCQELLPNDPHDGEEYE